MMKEPCQPFVGQVPPRPVWVKQSERKWKFALMLAALNNPCKYFRCEAKYGKQARAASPPLQIFGVSLVADLECPPCCSQDYQDLLLPLMLLILLLVLLLLLLQLRCRLREQDCARADMVSLPDCR